MLQSVVRYNSQPYFVLIGDTYDSSSVQSHATLQLTGHFSKASCICAGLKRQPKSLQLMVESRKKSHPKRALFGNSYVGSSLQMSPSLVGLALGIIVGLIEGLSEMT